MSWNSLPNLQRINDKAKTKGVPVGLTLNVSQEKLGMVNSCSFTFMCKYLLWFCSVFCQPMLSSSFHEISAKFSRSLDIFGVIIFCWPVFTWCSPFATLLCPSKSKGSRWGGVTQQKLMQRQQQFSNNESTLKQQWNGNETTTLKRQRIKKTIVTIHGHGIFTYMKTIKINHSHR